MSWRPRSVIAALTTLAVFTLHACEICGGLHYDLRNCPLAFRIWGDREQERLDQIAFEREERMHAEEVANEQWLARAP